MNVKTDDYVNFDIFDNTFRIEIFTEDLVRDFINEKGEFIDEVPEIGKVTDISSVLDYLDNKGIEYFYVNPHDFDFIEEGTGVLVTKYDKRTLVIVDSYGKIEFIGLLEGYEPTGIVDMLIRVNVYCKDNDMFVSLINDAYDYVTVISPDGTILTSEDDEYNEIIDKIKNCKELEVTTSRF